MRASWRRGGCNTNLGIVLLCAPLAAACERWRPPTARRGAARRPERVLEGARRRRRARCLPRHRAGAARAGSAASPSRTCAEPATRRPARRDGAGRATATASPGSTRTACRPVRAGPAGLRTRACARADGQASRGDAARVPRVPRWRCPIHTLCESTAPPRRTVSWLRRRPGCCAPARGETLDDDPAFAALGRVAEGARPQPGHERRSCASRTAFLAGSARPRMRDGAPAREPGTERVLLRDRAAPGTKRVSTSNVLQRAH